LEGLAAWIACVADARPLDEYRALLAAAGLVVGETEVHDRALVDSVEAIRSRLFATEIMVGLKKLELPSIDFRLVNDLVRHAYAAAKSGILGYAIVTAANDPDLAATASRHDLDAFPECDLAGDVGGSRLWVGIVPRSVDVLATTRHHGVVERRAFPGAYAGGLALAEMLPGQPFRWKIMVPLEHFGLPGFCDHNIVPDGFWHSASPHARCDEPGTACPSMSMSGR